jgi:hypothetical protein
VPDRVPVIVAVVLEVTALVVTLNVAVLLPAGIVTEDGTDAAALLLDSVTVMPPVGAFPVSVTVPVELAGPITLVGLKLIEVSAGAFTVRATDLLVPP